MFQRPASIPYLGDMKRLRICYHRTDKFLPITNFFLAKLHPANNRKENQHEKNQRINHCLFLGTGGSGPTY
jgi:hypothetical protein